MIKVIKRNSRGAESFDINKIIAAVAKAQQKVGIVDNNLPLEVASQTEAELTDEFLTEVSVDDIHRTVENILMDLSKDTAREYITYRKAHMPDIFKPRKSILPYEYPEAMNYYTAIQQAHWLHTEFNYDQDVAAYKDPNTPEQYRTMYARCLLAISQIEVAVKSYWKHIDDLFPKHEFSMLAAAFDSSEAIHFDTYRNLLDLVDLNSMFENIHESPVLEARSNSLQALLKVNNEGRKDILLKNIMFSSFIENVSLYSQFLILKAFSEKAGLFKGTANGVEATSTDEVTHHLAGVFISNTIIKENPELLDAQMREEILSRAHAGINEEYKLIEWLFDNKDLPFLTREQVRQFIAIRMHDSLSRIGISFLDKTTLATYNANLVDFDWFSDKERLLSQSDFFSDRETNYSKGTRVFSGESIFNDEFKRIMGDLNVPLA